MINLTDKIRNHLKLGDGLKGKHGERFLAMALAGEAGELALEVLAINAKAGILLNLIKKDWRGDAGVAERAVKIKAEIIDIANYVFMLGAYIGIEDMEADMIAKLIEVEGRDWVKQATAVSADTKVGDFLLLTQKLRTEDGYEYADRSYAKVVRLLDTDWYVVQFKLNGTHYMVHASMLGTPLAQPIITDDGFPVTVDGMKQHFPGRVWRQLSDG